MNMAELNEHTPFAGKVMDSASLPSADPDKSARAGDTAGGALSRDLSAALDAVEQAADEADAVEMVHDARKAMKQYRALLRLVPGEAAQAARRAAAAAARELSHARDRAAARDALQGLEEEGLLLGCDYSDALAAIGCDAAEEREAETHLRSLHAFLADARGRLAAGLAAAAEAADVGRGLRKGYAQARRATFETPEAMHEVRKRVVTHRYQMSFIAATFPGRGETRAARAQKLRDLFGAYQDIETLRPVIHAVDPPLPAGTLERLDLAMAREQKRLKKKAERRHAALFRRSPGSFLRKYRDIL